MARYGTAYSNLLLGTGQASTQLEADNLMSQFFGQSALDGFPAATSELSTSAGTLLAAGQALLQFAGEYADSQIANNLAEEAKTRYNKVISDNESVISDNTGWSELTRNLHYRGTDTVASVLEGQDQNGYLAAVNTILAQNNLPLINSLTEMANWGNDQFALVQEAFDKAVSDAHEENTTAGDTYLGELTSAGYSTESQTYKNASEVVEANNTEAGSWQPTIDEMNALAKSVDMTVDEFTMLRDSLQETANIDVSTEEGQRQLNELTRAVANAENGFEELQKVSKETWKDLKDESKKGTLDYIKNIQSLKKSMSKLFNTDMTRITDDFVERHLDDMEKMANGTEEEAKAAQDAIEDDLVAELLKADKIEATAKVNIDGEEHVINILDTLQNQLDQYDGEDVGFTITADTSPAISNM